MSSSLVSSILMYKLRALFSMLVLTARAGTLRRVEADRCEGEKQHQLRVLYFLHQLRVLYFLFSECGIINLVEKQNCTVHNGTWYNHTCYIVTDGGDHDKYNVNLTSEYMRSVLASRKSPSDEYFQYVSSITLLLLPRLVPSSEVAGMVLKSFFHFVLFNATSSFNPTLSVSLFYYTFIAIK